MPDERAETHQCQSQATSNIAWFLTGAFIGAAAAILYAPQSGQQTRQYLSHKTQQGRDSVYWWDGGALFGVVPKTLWSRKTPVDELNRIPLAFNCYLIRTGDHTILIETGG